MDVEEGDVTITVPGLSENGIEESVFYNPRQERNRDITIAALRTFRDRHSDVETYLDATAASGVRGVRAAADGWTVTCCDRNPDAVSLCEANLARNECHGEVVRKDANVLCHERRFDVVDLDPFGSPMAFADAVVRSGERMVCITATDTAPLCGAHFRAGIRRYSAVPRKTEYHPEVGLRVLLSALVRTAARHDLAATPVLSHVESHSVRTYLRIEGGAQRADDRIDELGVLWHCPECLFRRTERGLLAETRERCPNCGSNELLTGGPIWLGATHDPAFARETAANIDEAMGTARSARRLLERVASELESPTHYDQHVLCKRWGRSAGPMDAFIGGLREAGHDTSRTHYGGTTFKTTADVKTIRTATETAETTG